MPDKSTNQNRRWRFYRTVAGQEPVKDFILGLQLVDQQAIAAAMKDVEHDGLKVARHLRDDIYEVRANARTQSFRILFAAEGQHHQILLALEAFSKKTQRTPPREITLAETRLADWRQRARTP